VSFVTELKKDFAVRGVALTPPKLMATSRCCGGHPVDITDATQYAIDQFVLRGGKLLAFVDPHAYFDQSHERSENYTYRVGQCAASSPGQTAQGVGPGHGCQQGRGGHVVRRPESGDRRCHADPLNGHAAGIDENNVVTSQMTICSFPSPARLPAKPAGRVKETVLVKCSADSELVDTSLRPQAAKFS